MSVTRRSVLLSAPAMMAAAAQRSAPDLGRAVDPPAGEGSGMPYLVADPQGGALLSWLEPGEGKRHSLRFARWDKDGWTDPATIASGDNWFINWADFPSIAILPNGVLLAHWLERMGQGKYGYGIRVAKKSPGGSDWVPVFSAPPSDPEDYSGFLSFVARGDVIGASYLAPPATPSSSHRKTLRYVEFSNTGDVVSDRELDSDVCSCCQTAAVATASGPLVAYRDHQPGEIRDISVVRRVGSEWAPPQPLHRDGWVINACPTEGPALALVGPQLGAAWLTRAGGEARVQACFSSGDGRGFRPPVRVDSGNPLGRPGVVALGERLLVAWLEKTASAAELRLRSVSANGVLGTPVTIAAVAGARSAGFPKLAIVDGRILAVWRDTRVRARLIDARLV